MTKTLYNKNRPETIEVSVWWNNGGNMSYRRDCLSPSHPEHTYNYIKNQLGFKPEEYGIFHPDVEEYKDWSKKQLSSKIIELKQQLRSIEQFI